MCDAYLLVVDAFVVVAGFAELAGSEQWR